MWLFIFFGWITHLKPLTLISLMYKRWRRRTRGWTKHSVSNLFNFSSSHTELFDDFIQQSFIGYKTNVWWINLFCRFLVGKNKSLKRKITIMMVMVFRSNFKQTSVLYNPFLWKKNHVCGHHFYVNSRSASHRITLINHILWNKLFFWS